MLEEQRRSSVNTVALATFNVMDRYQILFRSKADQAVALQHNLSWLAKLITTLVHDPSERFKIMQNFPLPEGISLMAIDPSGEIKLVRGDLEKDDNPYLLRDIKDRPVGPTMRALAEKGLPATCFVQWDARGQKAAAVRNAPVPSRRGRAARGPVGQHRQARRASAAAQGRQHPGAPKRIRKTTDRAFGFSVRHGLQRYPGNRAGRHEHHPLRHQSQNRQHSYRRYPQCFENTGKSC